MDSGLVNEPLDLFKLDAHSLENLNLGTKDEPRLLGKNGLKLLDALQRTREKPLAAWIHAIGIPDVGAATAIELGKIHEDLEDLSNSKPLRALIMLCDLQNGTAHDLFNPLSVNGDDLPGDLHSLAVYLEQFGLIRESRDKKKKKYVTVSIGVKTAQSVITFFKEDIGVRFLNRMGELGISPKGGQHTDGAQPLAGSIFVITGKLESMGREEAFEKIRAAGGTIGTSVSKNTTYLVSGGNSEGTSKTEKAAKLGVKVISENDLLELLNQ